MIQLKTIEIKSDQETLHVNLKLVDFVIHIFTYSLTSYFDVLGPHHHQKSVLGIVALLKKS